MVRRLGYPSPNAVINAINKGYVINATVTAHDVYRAYKIYGPDIAALCTCEEAQNVNMSLYHWSSGHA
jgi:hypothetical protein